jgi:tetratricopeptide (TPR) repeat protein
MMVRAIRDLAKGDELVLQYYSHIDLDERTRHLQFYGFTCECPLCIEERRDPARQARMQIYYDFVQNKMESHPGEQEPLIASLEASFLPAGCFRFHLYRPFIGLAYSHWKNGALTSAVDAFERALEAEAPLAPMSERAKTVMDLARLLLQMGQDDNALIRVRQVFDRVQVETGIPPNEVLSIFPDLDPGGSFQRTTREVRLN